MLFRFIVLLMLTLAWSAGGCFAQEAELKVVSEDGISVAYPESMASQARRVLDLAKTSVGPSVEIHRQTVELLADVGAIASEISSLVGAEETREKVRIRLLAYKNKSEALVNCFSNLRLVETAQAAATGGVDAGVLQVRYLRDTDEFQMGLELETADPDRIKRTYFPIFVNADGSVRGEEKLVPAALDFLGSTKALIVAPVHETVGHVLAEQLRLYHPFTRWFNEGVSGWTTRRVVMKAQPKLRSILDELFSVNAQAKRYRDKVNFVAWPQAPFQNRKDPLFDSALESAQTRYAIQVISDLLGGNRGGTLAKIVGKIKHSTNANNDAICAAIKEVTGTDFRKTLLAYVPPDVKTGIDYGEAKKLTAQAERLAQEKKWSGAAEKLKTALQMSPEDLNARLNLAWIERELGERLDSELQVFIAARLLRQQEYSFHLFAASPEGNYVLGRLAILVGNLVSARQFLEPVLEEKPDHQDAKRAMDEVKKLEAAVIQSGD